VVHAVTLAHQAFIEAQAHASSGASRGSVTDLAALLDAICAEMSSQREAIVSIAHQESTLPIEPRLQGEFDRTINQLKHFAEAIREGSWVQATIDHALPDRKPVPRPDLRSMLVPIGPVGVFDAGNFPLAFGAAGNDVASALAAGNPVIVKSHPNHPRTNVLVGECIARALQSAGVSPHWYTVLPDTSPDTSEQLVMHPSIAAIGFTGSRHIGRKLIDLAATRATPIPVFAEMGSLNPLVILSGALEESWQAIASDLSKSILLGHGQFCTRPGVVLIPKDHPNARRFIDTLASTLAAGKPQSMLSDATCHSYQKAADALIARNDLTIHVRPTFPGARGSSALLAETTAGAFLREGDEILRDEIFGPACLVVTFDSLDEAIDVLQAVSGTLTVSLHAGSADMPNVARLLPVAQGLAGRVVFGGYPTGVEVTHAMVHGGPYPAGHPGGVTSIGSAAIARFSRPVCVQNCPSQLLPLALQDSNPLHILRKIDGRWRTIEDKPQRA